MLCIEKAREFKKNIYFCFTDYATAFDYMDHNEMLIILNETGISDHLTCLLRHLYESQETTVSRVHGMTDWFKIRKRVRRGCILSPYLFNLCAGYIMWNAGLNESQAGIKTAGRNANHLRYADAAAAKSLQSCPTLCDPIDSSPPGSPVPGILQARTLEWVAISFSNAWKWKVKVKSLSHVRLLATPWTAAFQAPPSMGFSRQEYWSGMPLPSLRYADDTTLMAQTEEELKSLLMRVK